MNSLTSITRRPASEHPDDVAEAHHKMQSAIAQVISLFDLYGELPGFERQYGKLSDAADTAKIDDAGRVTIADIVADDLHAAAEDAKADALAARYDARRDEEVFGRAW